MATGKEHPVWALYDEMFTIKVNIHYLEWDKKRLEDWDLTLEIFVAITTSAAVAGFWLWKTDIGAEVWKVIGLLAAIAAVVKPILTLRKKAQDATELLTDARGLDHEFNTIYLLIRQYDEYKDEYRVRFFKAVEYKGNFVKAYKAGQENKAVQERCYQRVVGEFPPEKFFIPSKPPTPLANPVVAPLAAPVPPDIPPPLSTR